MVGVLILEEWLLLFFLRKGQLIKDVRYYLFPDFDIHVGALKLFIVLHQVILFSAIILQNLTEIFFRWGSPY